MDSEKRLQGKNVLVIIPKDYYDEGQLEPLLTTLANEGADVRVASPKFKESVGMKGGRHMPDMLVVDAIEGITGDAYVSDGKGVRQVKGVFHGAIVVGGKGARKTLWNEKLVRLLLTDRYKSDMVVGAIGEAVPCLAEADLLRNLEVAAHLDKHSEPVLEKAAAIITDEDVCCYDRIVTARGAEVIDKFCETIIPEIAKTKVK